MAKAKAKYEDKLRDAEPGLFDRLLKAKCGG